MQIFNHKGFFLTGGVLLSATNLSAQTFSWVPAATSVPMSPSSLIILAILFMGAGLYLLMKSQNAATRSLFSILLLAGMFGFVTEAKAVINYYEITTPNGTDIQFSNQDGNNEIRNAAANVPVKITVDADGCAVNSDTCNNVVLQPGEACNVSLSCN